MNQASSIFGLQEATLNIVRQICSSENKSEDWDRQDLLRIIKNNINMSRLLQTHNVNLFLRHKLQVNELYMLYLKDGGYESSTMDNALLKSISETVNPLNNLELNSSTPSSEGLVVPSSSTPSKTSPQEIVTIMEDEDEEDQSNHNNDRDQTSSDILLNKVLETEEPCLLPSSSTPTPLETVPNQITNTVANFRTIGDLLRDLPSSHKSQHNLCSGNLCSSNSKNKVRSETFKKKIGKSLVTPIQKSAPKVKYNRGKDYPSPSSFFFILQKVNYFKQKKRNRRQFEKSRISRLEGWQQIQHRGENRKDGRVLSHDSNKCRVDFFVASIPILRSKEHLDPQPHPKLLLRVHSVSSSCEQKYIFGARWYRQLGRKETLSLYLQNVRQGYHF